MIAPLSLMIQSTYDRPTVFDGITTGDRSIISDGTAIDDRLIVPDVMIYNH